MVRCNGIFISLIYAYDLICSPINDTCRQDPGRLSGREIRSPVVVVINVHVLVPDSIVHRQRLGKRHPDPSAAKNRHRVVNVKRSLVDNVRAATKTIKCGCSVVGDILPEDCRDRDQQHSYNKNGMTSLHRSGLSRGYWMAKRSSCKPELNCALATEKSNPRFP